MLLGLESQTPWADGLQDDKNKGYRHEGTVAHRDRRHCHISRRHKPDAPYPHCGRGSGFFGLSPNGTLQGYDLQSVFTV